VKKRVPPTTQELVRALLSPEREQELDPFVVTTFMPMEPYDHVADIGCGPGYFSVPLAKHLVYGKLYALDVLDEMLEVTRRRVAESKLGNVEVLKCGGTEFPLPRGSLDGAFLAFVLHQTGDRVAFLKAVRELIKPRGWCTVLEWYPVETEHGPPLEKRIPVEELQRMAEAAGFRFRWSRELNPRQYMAVLRT
jgi:ubiquinone/menaquinone biosynthesis C-methylase UbiE